MLKDFPEYYVTQDGKLMSAARSLAASDYGASLPIYRVNITSDTIYYLVTRVIFSGGGNTASAFGRIQANRVA